MKDEESNKRMGKREMGGWWWESFTRMRWVERGLVDCGL